MILDTVSGSQCMLLLVIITVFRRSRRTVWSRALPDFKGPGSLAPFTLLSLDVSVKPLIVFVTALWVPNTLFNYLDSVLVYQISSFLESVVV